jgi:hypothetical protein
MPPCHLCEAYTNADIYQYLQPLKHADMRGPCGKFKMTRHSTTKKGDPKTALFDVTSDNYTER